VMRPLINGRRRPSVRSMMLALGLSFGLMEDVRFIPATRGASGVALRGAGALRRGRPTASSSGRYCLAIFP